MPMNVLVKVLPNRTTHWMVSLVCLVLCCAVAEGAQTMEPAYNGKALSEWLLELHSSPSSAELAAASRDHELDAEQVYERKRKRDEEAIRRIGTNGIPLLLEIVGVKHNNVTNVISKLKDQSFQELLRGENRRLDDFRSFAVDAFRILGRKAEPAVPQLTKLLHDPETSFQAARALCAVGPEGFSVLTNAVSDRDSGIRNNAVWALGQDEGDRGNDRVIVTQVLINCLRDPDAAVRGNAANFLAGKDPGLAIPALTGMLDDSAYYPRARAAIALGSFGPAAKSAAPKLLAIYTNVIAGEDKQLARNLGSSLIEALKKIDLEIAAKAESFLISSSPVSAARFGYTTTILRDGKVLVVGGYIHTSASNRFLASADLHDPVTGAWSVVGELNTARSSHTATLLPDRKVLVAAGNDKSGAALASAELYDPNTGKWTLTDRLNVARFGHTAGLQSDGTVMIAGGHTGREPLFDTELYDPGLREWKVGPAIADLVPAARFGHSATMLSDGRVLIAGGSNLGTDPFASTELYDPTSRKWTTSGALTTGRLVHNATLLPNGKVLVTGGLCSAAELYDPTTGKWQNAGALSTNSVGETVTLLGNGKLLIAGGESGAEHLDRAELYDPTLGKWTVTGRLNSKRAHHTATLLRNGKVLIAGGQESSFDILGSAELYDPSTGKWTETGPLNIERWRHTATLLSNGKVLVAGGSVGIMQAVSSAELYDPATGKWSQTGDLNSERCDHTATLLSNGQVLVTGSSQKGGGGPSSAEVYDPTTEKWTMRRSLTAERANHTATLLASGKVLIVGGEAVNPTEIYDPAVAK